MRERPPTLDTLASIGMIWNGSLIPCSAVSYVYIDGGVLQSCDPGLVNEFYQSYNDGSAKRGESRNQHLMHAQISCVRAVPFRDLNECVEDLDFEGLSWTPRAHTANQHGP